MKRTLTITTLAALVACGHSAPAPDKPAAVEPAVEAITSTAPDPEPTAAPPPPEGCRYTTAAGAPGASDLSIVGLPGGEDGYDMPDICPQQACSAGLTVDLPKAGDWQPGVYDIAVTTDAGTLRCHVTMSAPGPFNPPARCATERELSFECVRPEGPNLGPIMITGAPAEVRIAIARDGVTLADQTVHPAYSSKRWDGWDCHPSCRSGKATVAVR